MDFFHLPPPLAVLPLVPYLIFSFVLLAAGNPWAPVAVRLKPAGLEGRCCIFN